MIDHAIMAFYGGTSYDSQPHAKADHKVDWLKRSVENLQTFCKNVMIGVCAPKDRDIASMLVTEENVINFTAKFNPLFLPIRTCLAIQAQGKKGIIMYAETDQLFAFNKTPLEDHLYILRDQRDRYLIPWTYEDTYNLDGADWACRHCQFLVKVGGKTMQITNAAFPETLRNMEMYRTMDKYYTVPQVKDTRQGAPHTTDERSRCESFGGSFICHTDLFNKVKFKEGLPDPLERPLFDMFLAGKCLKPRDWSDFTRYHFGGGADHIERCNVQHPIYPQDQRWL